MKWNCSFHFCNCALLLSPFCVFFQRIWFSFFFIIYLSPAGNTLFILMAGSLLIHGPVEQSDAVWEHISVCSSICLLSFVCCFLHYISLSSHVMQFVWLKFFFICLLRFTPHLCCFIGFNGFIIRNRESQYIVVFATLVARLLGWQCLSVHRSVSNFSPDWNISTTSGWIFMEFCTEMVLRSWARMIFNVKLLCSVFFISFNNQVR